MIETINANCLDVLKETAANSQDLIFCDPPYALGSDVIIRKDGKPDYRKAVDFMSKWQQPDGYFWEQWFAEAFRVLRYGGRVVMFGMDRQLMLNKYYACFAGFAEQQSLYWYFISNFRKQVTLGKC
jgi:DNA modification methylase